MNYVCEVLNIMPLHRCCVLFIYFIPNAVTGNQLPPGLLDIAILNTR